MARYTTSVRSPWSAEDAFAFMSDLRNLERWDPGVVRAVQVDGDGGGPAATFDVTVKGVRGDLTMRYETVAYEPPGWIVVRATTSSLWSEDRISVSPAGDGCVVTYDAILRLRGVLGVFDPGLSLAFRRIGDRAGAGLRRVLEGADATPA